MCVWGWLDSEFTDTEWWCGMMLPLRLMPCASLLLLALTVCLTFYITASPLSVSHTHRHMGQLTMCVCLRNSCRKRLCTRGCGDLSHADFSLHSACSRCWGSRSEVVFHTSALARVYRWELYLLQTKSNLGGNFALPRGNSSLEFISHELL